MADGDFSVQVARAASDLRAFAATVRREVRPAIQKAAEPIVADARRRASWSRRIPKAIRVSVAKRGVNIVVSSARAPHGRVFEGIRGNSSFRHPVFGHRDRWVEQATRPYLSPAVEAGRGKVRAELVSVVEDAARKHGYR